MKAAPSLFSSATVAGLILLLAVVVAAVYEAGPDLATAREQRQIVLDHAGAIHFNEAQAIARQLLPEPSALWYAPPSKPGLLCILLGRGVWYAKGIVRVPQGDAFQNMPWEVCFYPGNTVPLYAKVGGVATGDVKAALHLAGDPQLQKGSTQSGD